MGHMVGKDVYRKLGKKIDNQIMRAPWSNTLYKILKELYTHEEAELMVKMPFGMHGLDEIEKVTGYGRPRLERLLASLADKGLVMDLFLGGEYRYAISPMIVGIFEFTMMRTRGEVNYKEWARLFHSYLSEDGRFYAANFGRGQKVSPLRALPHEGTVEEDEYVEVLDWEKASAIVDRTDQYAIGICSCRHEKMHAGVKECDVPLEKCSTLGPSTEWLVRHGFARSVSKTEMMENLAESKEMGLVFCADNVKKDISFICNCCGCCCNILLGVSRFGCTNTVVSSNYIARIDHDACSGCGNCAEACPVNAIEMADSNGDPRLDESVCIGCGVCSLKCETESLKLVARKQRVFYPENTFERVILQALERGTLQNLMFDNPESNSHKFLRGLVGGFLRLPPVKKSLMSDRLRSSFLNTLKRGG